MQFNFNFGRKKPTVIQYAVIGIILSSTIAVLSQFTHIKEDTLWHWLDQIQRIWFPKDNPINDIIISDPHHLDQRVKGDVNAAIRNVTPEYDRIIAEADKNKYKPVYQDLPDDNKACYTDQCKSLEPPMRICAPWVDDCPKE